MPSFHAIRIAAAISILIFLRESTARELRPSDHGLGYQSQPTVGLNSSDTMSFFGATSNSCSSSTPSTMAFPKATTSNDTSWWDAGGNRRGSDHVRQVLLLGSLVCGVTGLALLAASALVYCIKIRSSPSTHSTNNTNNINSLVSSISK
ncbi:hypothetical protein ERO13_A03G081000v2 [Gossypium hirsutum]|uniref:Uncharacterized protein n=5 Tax=Gossypium TaxID=3633 RepID=A0A2P5XF63_GOSBA|nr:uncharacterized protein LOC107887069 [Gossypium hirsutum]XP_017640948.1 uncharacterized protein LOC108482337 [Gossypium arboreum]KAB2089917.1 hypothetical protein ES319_A03G092400v1 [Gossypium barbadense]TYH24569.1 hypothetical protein ES288_A03G102300v1 [Gossypium darwinii]TYI35824.1 hypothetical protein ES332_A03G102500v1 [Gossypium tomentosum]KAG4207651.1 hypothetical protein ERO13_A03G081000v2 [Gossypium hirsutum]KAK5839881.1 hypothetical protein PVK06_008727 [Gossypium arboreum]